MEIKSPENYEIKVIPPEGYEIDIENSTFECIRFKPICRKWRDNKNALMDGYFISTNSCIGHFAGKNTSNNYCIFSSEKQAKSALAMARISQIMANDARFGGPVTDKEWNSVGNKYVIIRFDLSIIKGVSTNRYSFLAFHTKEQRDLFLEENEDLIKDYFML